MSDRTDRPGSREGRRGLRSVVQLYLSRPPKRHDPEEAQIEPETPPSRWLWEPSKVVAHRAPVEEEGAATTSAVPSAALEREAATETDAARELRERLDARIAAVSAIPFIDWEGDDLDFEDAVPEQSERGNVDAVSRGDSAVDEAAGTKAPTVASGPGMADPIDVAAAPEFGIEDAGLSEDADGGPFEPPEPVLSGISLDALEAYPGEHEPGAYYAFAEIVSARRPALEPATLGGDDELFPEDTFSEDALPPQEIGAEALRAELAFKLEEQLDTGSHEEPPLQTRASDAPSAPAFHETEIVFDEDILATGLPSDATSGGTIAEIFDLIDRSLSLGPGAIIEVPSSQEASVIENPPIAGPTGGASNTIDEGAWDILPEETPPEAVRESRQDALPQAPGAALFLSTLPPRMRRKVLEIIGAPHLTEGRRVLFLDPDPSDDEGLIEEALGLDTAARWRRLGASPREILLMRPTQRAELFAALADEESRSELVLLGVGLPESIVCPRMLPLVDTIVVGLTRQESSLYEAYRALRGLPLRRPGVAPYAVTIASSAEEAALLLERFRQIAQDFLRMSVLDGGWLDPASLPDVTPETARSLLLRVDRDATRPGIAPDLLARLERGRRLAHEGGSSREAAGPGSGDASSASTGHDGRPEAPFFEQLAEWFGPAAIP